MDATRRRLLNDSETPAVSQTSQVSWADSLRSAMRLSQRYLDYALDFTPATLSPSAVTPEILLNMMLSTRSTISTTSSIARRNVHASINSDTQSLVLVGAGQCGAVWHMPGTDQVYKLPKGNQKINAVFNDQIYHTGVLVAFKTAPSKLTSDISIPRQYGWLSPKHIFWTQYDSIFPPDAPKYALISEFITQAPLPIREALVDVYLPAHLKAQKDHILADPLNKSCLIRIYLGERNPDSRKSLKTFKLRNFPLLVNDMEKLDIDTERLAIIMADALAVMHWKAQLDANDVEFVFGSSAEVKNPEESRSREQQDADGLDYVMPHTPILDYTRRYMRVWLLDFNECAKFQYNEAGLRQICNGFWFNDPYFPRPVSTHPNDVHLWAVFRDRYLLASKELTDSNMPRDFIREVEATGQKRREQQQSAGENSLFGLVLR